MTSNNVRVLITVRARLSAKLRRSRLEVHAFAAAAGALHIGVLELEAVPHHPGDEVERRALQVEQALGIDEDLHLVTVTVWGLELEHPVARLGRPLRPLEQIRKAVAPAAAQTDTQPPGRLALGPPLFIHLANLRHRRRRARDLQLLARARA